MKNSTRRSRRHRNPHTQDQAEQRPFFNKANNTETATSKNAFFQPKLTIGQPNDKYEKEADSMADAVVNQSSDAPAVQEQAQGIQRMDNSRMEEDRQVQEKAEIQRMEQEEEAPIQQKSDEEEEPVQMQAEEEEPIQKMEEEEQPTAQMKEEEEAPPVQTKTNTPKNARTASPQLSQRIKDSSGGRSMSNTTQTDMESAFGTDFSGVNIHTDSNAVQMNKELGAQAFTHGNDIYFNTGKYKPDSVEGKHLLAHELTHVVQQGKAQKKKNIVTETAQPSIQRGFFKKVWGGIKKIGRGIAGGAKKLWSGAKWLGRKVAGGAKAVWNGLKWLGGKAWTVLKWIGKYIYRVGESAIAWIWTLITQFPKRMFRLLKHLFQIITVLPVKIWEALKLLFSGDFKGFAKFLWESTKAGAAWVGRLIAKVADVLSVGELLDLIGTIIKVNTRKLTNAEMTEAKAVFGNSVDLWRVRVDEYSLIAWLGKVFQGAPDMGVTTFHTINFSQKISAAACNGDMAWLIHELVHVAQMEHVGMQYMGEAIHAQQTAGYAYGGGAALVGKNLRDFNREQQGDIIKDYYNLIHCGSGTHPYAAEYQRMISDLQAGKL